VVDPFAAEGRKCRQDRDRARQMAMSAVEAVKLLLDENRQTRVLDSQQVEHVAALQVELVTICLRLGR